MEMPYKELKFGLRSKEMGWRNRMWRGKSGVEWLLISSIMLSESLQRNIVCICVPHLIERSYLNGVLFLKVFFVETFMCDP